MSLSNAMLGCAILATSLMGGFFFAFSAGVMRALSRLPAPAGITAMQSINRAVLNPVFLSTFFGTALLGFVLIVLAVSRWQEAGAGLLAAGGCAYLLGVFAVTMLRNVPMNTELSRLDPAAPDATTYWRSYLRRWSRWNHLRALMAMLAALLLLAALDMRYA